MPMAAASRPRLVQPARADHDHRQSHVHCAMERVDALFVGERQHAGPRQRRNGRGGGQSDRAHSAVAPVVPDNRGQRPSGPAGQGGRDRVEIGVGRAVVEAARGRDERALGRADHEEVEVAVGEQRQQHVCAIDLRGEHRRAEGERLPFNQHAAPDAGGVNHAVDRSAVRLDPRQRRPSPTDRRRRRRR